LGDEGEGAAVGGEWDSGDESGVVEGVARLGCVEPNRESFPFGVVERGEELVG